jgi:cytochrome P450
MNGGTMELALSALVIVAALLPLVRILALRPVRREFAAHKALGAVAAFIALLAVALGVWMVTATPLSRRMTAVLAAVAGIVAWLHARPSLGRRRGLPPGSLGLRTSLEAVDDPSFYARGAATHGKVFKMRQVHQPVACVTDLETINDVLRRDDGSLGQSEWSFNRLVPGGYLEYMEGDPHSRYRQLFATAFSDELVAAARETIAATSRAQLAEMARAAGNAGVHPEPFLYQVPFAALCHTILGVQPGHPRTRELNEGFAAITVPFEVHLPTPPSIAAGYESLVSITRDLGRSAAESPVASVLQSVVRQDQRLADDPTVLGNLVLMVKEGSIMVRGLLRWILRAMASDPSLAERLRAAAPDATQLDALSVAIVRETLRLHESRYLYRTARREVAVGGYRVPQRWLVRLCLGEAHEDPRHFPDPQRFDPSRFLGAVPGLDRYCPFGAGTHSCLGDSLTLAIAGGFVREAAMGWDIRSVSDGPMWRINRHWGLWRPSLEFRVTLSPASH